MRAVSISGISADTRQHEGSLQHSPVDQFHDILAGAAIEQAYIDARNDLRIKTCFSAPPACGRDFGSMAPFLYRAGV